jgi:glycogen debranching enzyme
MSRVHSFHPTVVLHGNNTALVSDLSGQLAAEELHGFFAGDTRMLSTYKFDVNGCAWRLLARSRFGHGSATWHFQNPDLRDQLGDVPSGLLSFTVRRRIAGAMHDDLLIQSFAGRPVRLRLILQLDADFADIFEVKSRSMPPRMDLLRLFDGKKVALVHEAMNFRRALHVSLFCPNGTQPSYAGSRVTLDVNLEHGQNWSCCVEAVPEIDGHMLAFSGDPHQQEPAAAVAPESIRIECAPLLKDAFERGQADLHALQMSTQEQPSFVAAGAPWFLSLFGRDSLTTALMTGIDGSGPAEGCLKALGVLQGKRRDDFKDEEPGKIAHELRRDELTHLGKLPYSPYYGTHDAPALYCLTLWQTWRWTGCSELLAMHFETARKAMRWCDELGDSDHDGFQEYATRSTRGYRNQGWKDAGDAIVDAQGRQAGLPIATVELQGYVFAARLAMAELCDALEHKDEANRFRRAAATLRAAVESRFWLESEDFYAIALDGRKRTVDGISSNPGHLLWCGLPDPARAARIARRLLQPDLFSGWGLRTLSSRNPAYNPLSYQLGSVWPHDTLIASAGLWRYGLREEACVLIHAVLQAAQAMEDHRLPELFCGFDASEGFPVPYEQANIPQAWAAAVPLLSTQLLLGLVPDAPRGRCFVSPWLPQWLPRLELRRLRVGQGKLDIAVARHGNDTLIETMDATGIEVICGETDAPLGGRPVWLRDKDMQSSSSRA